MAKDESKQRIKIWMATLLVTTAFGTDLMEMFLEWLGIGFVLSPFISIGAGFGFWLWFKLLNVQFIDFKSIKGSRKFLVQSVTTVLEIIPGLDAIGGFVWTIGIFWVVALARFEDGDTQVVRVVSRVAKVYNRRLGQKMDNSTKNKSEGIES